MIKILIKMGHKSDFCLVTVSLHELSFFETQIYGDVQEYDLALVRTQLITFFFNKLII